MPFAIGPTYAEMEERAGWERGEIYRIGWEDGFVHVPRELTGVETSIVVLPGCRFPVGSLKVGPAYAMVMEAERTGRIQPEKNQLVVPSAGNFAVAAAWVARHKGYRLVAVSPHEPAPAYIDELHRLGAEFMLAPASGPAAGIRLARELEAHRDAFVIFPYQDFASYRFHHRVTGGAVLRFAQGPIAAFVAGPGTGGALAAGDRIKMAHPEALNVAAEFASFPVLARQSEAVEPGGVCPLVLNVRGLDRVVTVEDELVRGVWSHLASAEGLEGIFGPSGARNVAAAVTIARAEGFGPDDTIVTVAPDGVGRHRANLPAAPDPYALGRLREVGEAEVIDVTSPGDHDRVNNQKEAFWGQWYSAEFLRELRTGTFWANELSRSREVDSMPYPEQTRLEGF